MESTAVGIGVPLDDVDTAFNEDLAEVFEEVGDGGCEVGRLPVPHGMVVDLETSGSVGGNGSRHCC